jgi:hypothetical protein
MKCLLCRSVLPRTCLGPLLDDVQWKLTGREHMKCIYIRIDLSTVHIHNLVSRIYNHLAAITQTSLYPLTLLMVWYRRTSYEELFPDVIASPAPNTSNPRRLLQYYSPLHREPFVPFRLLHVVVVWQSPHRTGQRGTFGRRHDIRQYLLILHIRDNLSVVDALAFRLCHTITPRT